MKKIIALLALIATTCTSCHYIEPGIYQETGTAETKTSFNIDGEIYSIYDDVLQQSETYIIILSDNASPFNPVDDEILNYYDLETWELMHMKGAELICYTD